MTVPTGNPLWFRSSCCQDCPPSTDCNRPVVPPTRMRLESSGSIRNGKYGKPEVATKGRLGTENQVLPESVDSRKFEVVPPPNGFDRTANTILKLAGSIMTSPPLGPEPAGDPF